MDLNNKKFIDTPFFLLYDARSGSTFLSNLLMQHLKVVIPPESNFLVNILKFYSNPIIQNVTDLEQVLSIIYKEDKFQDWKISRDEIMQEIIPKLPMSVKNFLLKICSIYRNIYFPQSGTFGIKKGNYYKNFDIINLTFPNAKYIGIIRDGRAIFNSKKKNIMTETGKLFETNPYKAAYVWCKFMKRLAQIKMENIQILIIHYEDLIRNPTATINLISIFLKINEIPTASFAKNTYNIPQRYRDIQKNFDKKPIIQRINAWKNSLTLDEIFAFESIAYKYLYESGYSLRYPVKLLVNPIFSLKLKLNHLEWWDRNRLKNLISLIKLMFQIIEKLIPSKSLKLLIILLLNRIKKKFGSLQIIIKNLKW